MVLFFLLRPRRYHYTSWLFVWCTMCQSPHTQAPHGPTSVSFPARGTFSSLSLSRFFSNNGREQAAIITSTQGYHGSYCGVFGENARRCVVFFLFFNFLSVKKEEKKKKPTLALNLLAKHLNVFDLNCFFWLAEVFQEVFPYFFQMLLVSAPITVKPILTFGNDVSFVLKKKKIH